MVFPWSYDQKFVAGFQLFFQWLRRSFKCCCHQKSFKLLSRWVFNSDEILILFHGSAATFLSRRYSGVKQVEKGFLLHEKLQRFSIIKINMFTAEQTSFMAINGSILFDLIVRHKMLKSFCLSCFDYFVSRKKWWKVKFSRLRYSIVHKKKKMNGKNAETNKTSFWHQFWMRCFFWINKFEWT
jgi:hypothetical protein